MMGTSWFDLTDDEREQALAALSKAAGRCADALMFTLNGYADRQAADMPYRFRVIIELWPTDEDQSNVVRLQR